MNLNTPKQLSSNYDVELGSDSPTVYCENCQAPGLRHRMINLIIGVGSPGHETLAPFTCLAEQEDGGTGHWACSPACWKEIAHACIDEHMHTLLLQAHQSLQS